MCSRGSMRLRTVVGSLGASGRDRSKSAVLRLLVFSGVAILSGAALAGWPLAYGRIAARAAIIAPRAGRYRGSSAGAPRREAPAATAEVSGGAEVAVFPLPGSRYNRPTTQIAFRGVSPDALRGLRVVGSRTGVHTGRVLRDSDGDGASFLPAKPFALGETATVSTRLNVLGATNGRFTFTIGHVLPLIRYGKLGGIPPIGPNGLMHFASEPAFEPPSVTVTTDDAPASEGDIFLAPQNGPVQDGPMILDPHGQLIWFSPYPIAKEVFVNDFRVQDLYGEPVLTFWQGFRNAGFGQSRGVGVILNRRYQRIATVRAANGLDAGSHEFLVTPAGDAYVTASSPVSLPGVRDPTIDSVVQEIDIKTGLVLFDWHALDHVPLSATYPSAAHVGNTFDPYHINSISLANDGNLLVSMRNTSSVYEIDHQTGRVLWTLGGKQSSFTMGPGTTTYLQHDAIPQPDGTLTIFDNGGGLPFAHPQSRGIREQLNPQTMSATLVAEYDHTPPLRTAVEGGMQMLPDGNVFIGWGYADSFSEFDAAGHQIFDAHFNESTASYRAYRFTWDGQPATPPVLIVSAAPHGPTRFCVSWNGATDVSSWRLQGGTSPRRLKPVTTVPKAGFETGFSARTSARYFAVQALDEHGRVLASSRAITTGKPARAGHR